MTETSSDDKSSTLLMASTIASTGVLTRAFTQAVAVRRMPHTLSLMSKAETLIGNKAARKRKVSLTIADQMSLLSSAAKARCRERIVARRPRR